MPATLQTAAAQAELPFEGAATAERSALAPGVYVRLDLPERGVWRFGHVELVRLKTGDFFPFVRCWAELHRISEADNLIGVPYAAVRRLIHAGFVEASQLTPGAYLLDLGSFAAHLAATRDPSFWNAERLRDYRTYKSFGGGPSGKGGRKTLPKAARRNALEAARWGAKPEPPGGGVNVLLAATGHKVVCDPVEDTGLFRARDLPREAVPTHVCAQLMRMEDGTFRPNLRQASARVPFDQDHLLRDLGLPISRQGIKRLIAAGHIQAEQPEPDLWVIDLASLLRHINRTRERGWWTEERLAEYRELALD